MIFTIQPMVPGDANEALELLKTLSDTGEVLYKPLEKEDFLNRFFGEKRWGFVARSEEGKEWKQLAVISTAVRRCLTDR